MSEPDLGIIAVDIGATKLALHARRGHCRRVTRELWSGADLDQLAQALTRAHDWLGGRVDRIGVACAATLDAGGRVTVWPSRPSWTGQPVLDVISEATAGAPIVVGDDGGLAALAEAAAAGCANLAYLGLGTGLGGGLVVDGRLVTGAYGTAGEIGHVPIGRQGQRCRCGRRSCLQATASGPALAARATQLRGRLTTESDLVTALRSGRRWAQRAVDEAAAGLAHGIVIVAELVQPARVHLGGGLGHALTDLPTRVSTALAALSRPGRPLPVVAPARYGADASLAGALLAARLGGTDLVAERGEACAQAS